MKMSMKSILCVAGLLLLGGHAMAAPETASPALDFTRGDKPDAKANAFFMHLDGVVMGIPNLSGDRAREARQIYVSDVKGHYSTSLLRVGDVFMGVNGKLFEGNAIDAFRRAVSEAKLSGGAIHIILWRDGAQTNVDVLALPPPPDLTKGGKKDTLPDWNLGPTGAKGWIFCRGLDTSEARQILVGAVEKGSPADGVLAVDDVILGVDGKPFDGDARKMLGCAITEAEKTENQGALRLIRWRPFDSAQGGQGTQEEVTVHIKVMGRYSETAPFDCRKSTRIVEQGCRAIMKRGIGDGIVGNLNALALLASGNPEYLDAVKASARKVGPADMKLELKEGMYAWEWGYANLFLTEYYLATKDEYVLPAIREYSRTMALGQGAVGTWGHGMRVAGNNGTLGGYGAVNQAGLICWMSMALAQKCGIEDPVIRKAAAHSQTFFGFFAGKGCIPYGDHPAGGAIHDNNGTSGSAALAFDFLGDKAGTRFFSRMATAAFDEKELGHTGNFFGYLWGPLGANRAGPDAVAAYLKELRGYYDMARRWDGSFGTTDKNNYGWDMTGLFVLHYSLPLKELYITGKGIGRANRLTGRALREVLESGRDFNLGPVDRAYVSKSNDQLLMGLGNWSASVRHRSAAALAGRDGVLIPPLVGLLKSKNPDARYGACLALQYMEGRAAPATDELIRLLSDKDMWLRIRAAFALAEIGPPARKAVPQMLKMAGEIDKDDPRGTLCRYLSFVLFKADYVDNLPRRDGLLADSLDGVDRELLYPAVRRMLTLDDGMARFATRSVLRNLSAQDLQTLRPDIARVAGDTAPSGEMYAQQIRVDAAELMARNKIPEGMNACIEYARTQNGWGSRTIDILAVLKTYGSAARAVLPELKELHKAWKAQEAAQNQTGVTRASVAEDVIKAIEAAQ